MRGITWERVKKNCNRRLAVICLTASMVISLAGCGAVSKDTATNMAMPQTASSSNSMDIGAFDYASEKAVEMEMYDSSGSVTNGQKSQSVEENAAQTNRKLIRTVNLDVETKEFDSLLTAVENQVKALDGYIENMNTYNGSTYYGYRGTRNADMTIRIPAASLDDFLNTITGISNVVRRSENVDDITLSYVDLQSHKKTLQTEQTRLLALLEKAETIEDILVIESRLSEVRYQLESMESQLRTYDNKVDYSTVYLNIDEVEVLTPVEEETIGERISGGFIESLKDIGNGLVEFAVWFLVHLPYLILWAVIISVIVIVIRLLIKRGEKKREKKALERAKQQAEMQAMQMQQIRQAQQTGQSQDGQK